MKMRDEISMQSMQTKVFSKRRVISNAKLGEIKLRLAVGFAEIFSKKKVSTRLVLFLELINDQ